MHIPDPITKKRRTVRKTQRLQSILKFRLKIRILSHRTIRFHKDKISICAIITWKIPVQQSTIRIGASTSIFPETHK